MKKVLPTRFVKGKAASRETHSCLHCFLSAFTERRGPIHGNRSIKGEPICAARIPDPEGVVWRSDPSLSHSAQGLKVLGTTVGPLRVSESTSACGERFPQRLVGVHPVCSRISLASCFPTPDLIARWGVKYALKFNYR